MKASGLRLTTKVRFFLKANIVLRLLLLRGGGQIPKESAGISSSHSFEPMSWLPGLKDNIDYNNRYMHANIRVSLRSAKR